MKKLLSIILVMAFVAGLAACVVAPPPNPLYVELTDENGEVIPNTDHVLAPITLPEDVVTEPVTVDNTTAPTTAPPPPPTQTPTDPTTTTTTAPAAKAKLYPSSGFAKALKSDKYYMEVLITSFDENNTRGEQFSAVRARDGKQQYLRVDTDFNIALLNTGKALTLLVPRESLGEQLRNEDAGFIEGLRNNIGRNLGLALSFSDIMKEATGESVLDMPEIDQIFSIVEMIFKDVGKFQYASTASSATKKYDVEVFKAGEDKLFFYFIQGEKEVSLVKREFKDGTSIMVNINVLNTKPDAKFFKVPAGYLNLSGETLKNFSALLG